MITRISVTQTILLPRVFFPSIFRYVLLLRKTQQRFLFRHVTDSNRHLFLFFFVRCICESGMVDAVRMYTYWVQVEREKFHSQYPIWRLKPPAFIACLNKISKFPIRKCTHSHSQWTKNGKYESDWRKQHSHAKYFVYVFQKKNANKRTLSVWIMEMGYK